MHLPPGPDYILQNLAGVVLPPTLVIVASKLLHLNPQLDIAIPTWAVIVGCIFSVPVALVLRTQYQDFSDARAAKAYGAVLPPRVKDRWPEGLGLLLTGMSDGYPGDRIVEWEQTYGRLFNVRTLFENKFFTTEPEYIKAILASQFDGYEKGPVFNKQVKTILGTGVFNSDGEMWKFHRAMTRPFFSKDRISHFDIFDRHATDALNQVKARLREGFPIDIQDVASRFTLDSATEFLFNQNVHSLGVGLPFPYNSAEASSSASLIAQQHPANKFSLAFGEAQRLTSKRARLGMNWPLAEFWQDKVAVHMETIHAFINPILHAAVERKREAAASKVGQDHSVLEKDREVKDGESLLDHLINYTEDEIVLRDEILNIMLAGRDTTTNTITCAVYMLSKHPKVFQTLRQEILETVGEVRRPTFEDMKNMKYLRAVVNETLRLYPAVPSNVRTSSKPVVLPGKNGAPPFYIPANTRSPYSVFIMHRRKDLWGPDANEFDPDRFIDDRLKKYLTPNPFIFLPFNAGPRICLGQQFAYHETSFFLIRLLQQFSKITHVFDAQPPDSRPPKAWMGAEGSKGSDRIRIKSHMTMSVAGGCWVSMEEAETEAV